MSLFGIVCVVPFLGGKQYQGSCVYPLLWLDADPEFFANILLIFAIGGFGKTCLFERLSAALVNSSGASAPVVFKKREPCGIR